VKLPRLYAIADAGFFPETKSLIEFAQELATAGILLLQYRNKKDSPRRILDDALALRKALPADVRLIMNDRADLALAADVAGVHVGQEDLSPESVRGLIGPTRWLGVSTHNAEELGAAHQTSADYLAIGPVFSTTSKAQPDPMVGLEGVRRARALTTKPLVAIGGITRQNCLSVLDAGADSVAVISDLIVPSETTPRAAAEDFLRLFSAY
jgi:thiamine-phosphate pyrophosphorylase